MTIEFFLTSLVIILLPGTGVLYTISIGINQGFKSSFAAAFGCTLGILPAAMASIIGLAALFHTSSIAFQAIKYLGVAYLFFMAWNTLRDHGVLNLTEQNNEPAYLSVIVKGMLLNVLNPKISLFFLAFLPQFVSIGSEAAVLHLTLLALLFMILTFIVFIGYGACASLARDYVVSRPSVLLGLKRAFAGAFGLLALKLAFTR